MKLVRFGAPGAEKPGLVGRDGTIRDLSGHVKDIDGSVLSDAGLAKLRAIDPASLPAAPAGVRLGAPVGNVRNFVAIGLNYADHAKEAGQPIPTEPIIFYKLTNCICGPNDDVMIPRGSTKLDWELEIAFVVGKRSRYVELKDAASHIAGYTICNDVSERHFQIERGGQWMKGKCAETFGPLGPWLVTADEVKDVNSLPMSLDVNGKRDAERLDEHDDLQVRLHPALRLAVHGARAGRRRDDGHAAGRRPRHEAADVPQGRRRHEARRSRASARSSRRSCRSSSRRSTAPARPPSEQEARRLASEERP